MPIKSGITVSSELQALCSDIEHSNHVRFIKAVIDKNMIIIKEKAPLQGDWKKDFDGMRWMCDVSTPCYFIFQRNPLKPIIALYCPQTASKQDKMIYTSSRSALNACFSATEQYFGETKGDFTFDKYTQKTKKEDSVLSVVEKGLLDGDKEKANAPKAGLGLSILAIANGKKKLATKEVSKFKPGAVKKERAAWADPSAVKSGSVKPSDIKKTHKKPVAEKKPPVIEDTSGNSTSVKDLKKKWQ